MRAFLIELARAALVAWGKAWRLIIRKKRNFFLFIGGVLAVLIVSSGILDVAAPNRPSAATTPQPTATATVPYTTVTAEPLNGPAPSPTESESYSVDGGNPQAVPGNTPPPLPSTEPVEIPAPTEPSVNPQDQESVAEGFITAYLSRPNAEWTDWQEWVSGYSTAELVNQLKTLAFQDNSALDGKTPTRVTEVTINPAGEGAGRDTPVRWSRSLDVVVQSGDGTTTLITYAVVLSLSDAGWIVIEAVEKSWTLAQ